MHYNKFEFFTYVDSLNQENIVKLNKKVHIIFRNYKKRFKNHELLDFVNFCKKKNLKIYLSNDIKKAKNLGFDGVYVPSFNKLPLNYDIGIKNGFTILGSAHNINELLIKKKQKIDIIFICPLFKNKKNNNNLGVVRFNLISKYFEKKVMALGGINRKNKNMLKLLNIYGFAAISYFKNTI
jgi:thiamine-phosphate pyrophosphorylase